MTGTLWGRITPSRTYNFGLLANKRVTVNNEDQCRIAGPFFDKAEHPDGAEFRAVRPLYSSVKNVETGEVLREYLLWPLGMSKRFEEEFRWRFLNVLYLDPDAADPASQYRFWVLPLYFQGRDAKADGYAALFPLGGTLHNFLGRDTIRFCLFPLYAYSAINDVETWSYLWPLISRSKGEDIDRFRVFPFYGKSIHEGVFEKTFILWPVWTSVTYRYPASSGFAYILWPLWGHTKLTDQESWMALPPFFRYDKGEQLTRIHAPWPFIQISSGEIDKFYIWPLWGRKTIEHVQSWFFLWPVVRAATIDRGDAVHSRFAVLPFWYSKKIESKVDEKKGGYGVVELYRELWPLGSYHREGKETRFRLLDLWPGRDRRPVERNWAPFWTLCSYTANGNACESEFLWGTYSRRKEGDTYSKVSLFPLFSWSRDVRKEEKRRLSLLGGLLEFKKEGVKKSFRLFYFLKFDSTVTPKSEH